MRLPPQDANRTSFGKISAKNGGPRRKKLIASSFAANLAMEGYTVRGGRCTVCSPAFGRLSAWIPAEAGTTNIGRRLPRRDLTSADSRRQTTGSTTMTRKRCTGKALAQRRRWAMKLHLAGFTQESCNSSGACLHIPTHAGTFPTHAGTCPNMPVQARTCLHDRGIAFSEAQAIV